MLFPPNFYLLDVTIPEIICEIYGFMYDFHKWSDIINTGDLLLIYNKIQSGQPPSALASVSTAIWMSNTAVLQMMLDAYGAEFLSKSSPFGRLDMLKWYVENVGALDEHTLNDSVQFGIETVRWLCEDQRLQPSAIALMRALMLDVDLEVIGYLLQRGAPIINDQCFVGIVGTGGLSFVNLNHIHLDWIESAALYTKDAKVFNALFPHLPNQDWWIDKFITLNNF